MGRAVSRRRPKTTSSPSHYRPYPRTWQASGKRKTTLRIMSAVPPFEDVPVARIFFLRVGKELRIRTMKGAEALLKMLGLMRERQRFVGAADRKSFLDLFGDFVRSAEIWDLELSPDLHDLDELAAFVKGRSKHRRDETLRPGH